MENDKAQNRKAKTPKELRSGNANINANTNPKKGKKWGLVRHWKAATRKQQLTWVLKAIGGLITAGVLAVYVWDHSQRESQFAAEHTPLVVHSRPPQLLMPVVCNPKTNSLTTGNMTTFVKNVGTATALDVDALFVLPKVVPEKRTGQPFFDDPPSVNCGLNVNKTPMDFPLPVGIEKGTLVRQSVMSLPPLHIGDIVQLYLVQCVSYRDTSAKHATCDRYRMMIASSNPLDKINGTPSFSCDGTPKMGVFGEDMVGHCQQ